MVQSALIEDGTPVISLLSDAVLASHTRGNIQEVAARGAKVLTIAEENVAKEGDDIVLNNVHPYLSPISMVVPTQLIAYFATLHRGLTSINHVTWLNQLLLNKNTNISYSVRDVVCFYRFHPCLIRKSKVE